MIHNKHIFEILKFSKKSFFLHFCLVLQADLNVFLICYKFCLILCANCPKIKIFIWINTLVPKMIKSHLVCICGHVAHFFFNFPFGHRNFGSMEKSGGFTSQFERFFQKIWVVTNCAQFCVPLVRKSKFLYETTLWCLKW